MTDVRTKKPEEMETAFGYARVGTGEKQPLVDEVFHKVAGRYDLMNDLMSAGMHRIWKDAMINVLSPPRPTGKKDVTNWKSLDVAGGTGDIAFRIIERGGSNVSTTVLDINSSMLEVGRARAAERGLSEQLEFIEGDAQELPFDANLFDAYTIAFGIRNVPRIDKALKEAFRVLKPGGRFLCLEFSEVDMPMLDKVYERWSMDVIPQIGKVVTGEAEPYQYLVESIRKFPNQKNFAEMISEAGFSKVTFQNFTGGVVALHSGWKL